MLGRRSLASVVFAILCSATPARALEVWVDGAGGSDGNAGTEEAPFATIQRACDAETDDARLVVHILPGDYREFVEIRRDGTRLRVAAADRGRVVLSGSEPSSSLTWTREDPAGLPAAAAGQVWWADLSEWEVPPQIVTQMLGDGTISRLTPAREPDFAVTTDWKQHEHWETAGIAPLRYWDDEDPGSELSAHYLSSPFLADQWGDLTGGRAWIKDAHSGHDTYSAGIVQHWVGEGTIEVSRACEISGGEDGLGEDSKFFVEGKAVLLDQEGEWFFDEASGRLWVWPVGGGDPGGLGIEIARREQGISNRWSDFLVDGLVLRGLNYRHDYWNTRASGIYVHSSTEEPVSGVTIRNSVFEHAGRGIHVVAATGGGGATIQGLLVEDSTMAHIDGQAMNVQSWPIDMIGVRDVIVQRCLLEDSGFRNPEPTDSMGIASFSRVGELRFLDNEVARSPHNSVQINYGCENVLVRGNHVHHCGLNAADNGCIKFWNNTDHFDPGAPRSILVTENLVHDSMGWAYSSEVNEWWQTTGLSGSGFYCDYYKGVTFFRNVVHTVGSTAFWPNTPSNLNWSINNTVLDARHGASCSRQSMDTPDQGEALVMNNLFMNFTTWGFPADHYWGQLESGLLYSRTDDLLVSHHNAFHEVALDLLYVDASNNGNRYETVEEVVANTPYEAGSIDIDAADDVIVEDAASWDVRPVAGSPVIDAGDDLPPEIADLFDRLGLVLPEPEGDGWDIGAIEGAGPPWLRVVFPNGGEVLPTGGEVEVTWESASFVGPVGIDLATGYSGTPEWQTLVDVTPNDGSEPVVLPAVHDPSCRIRIHEAIDEDPEDLSDDDFEIGDAILVTSPEGGEELEIGRVFEIRWSSGGVTDVDIELSRDAGGSWETISSSVPATERRFEWTVTGPTSDECVVRIADATDDDPVGLSNGTFSIVRAEGDDEGGCSCRLIGRSAGLGVLVLLGGPLLLFRRRGRPA